MIVPGPVLSRNPSNALDVSTIPSVAPSAEPVVVDKNFSEMLHELGRLPYTNDKLVDEEVARLIRNLKPAEKPTASLGKGSSEKPRATPKTGVLPVKNNQITTQPSTESLHPVLKFVDPPRNYNRRKSKFKNLQKQPPNNPPPFICFFCEAEQVYNTHFWPR